MVVAKETGRIGTGLDILGVLAHVEPARADVVVQMVGELAGATVRVEACP